MIQHTAKLVKGFKNKVLTNTTQPIEPATHHVYTASYTYADMVFNRHSSRGEQYVCRIHHYQKVARLKDIQNGGSEKVIKGTAMLTNWTITQ